MKKIRLFHRGLTLLTLIFVLTLGLLMVSPLDGVYASTDDGKDKSGSTEQTDGTAGASAGASTFEHYEPLPIEPIHREANNVLLGSGLGVAALIIGGAFVLDKRNQ